MTILNLTQHVATPEQATLGVIEPADKKAVQELLTFFSLPTADYLRERANKLARLAKEQGATSAMIGGAGYFMPYLERALMQKGITPLHAFTVRDVVETVKADGSVEKTAVFKHAGFVQASDFIYDDCYLD